MGIRAFTRGNTSGVRQPHWGSGRRTPGPCPAPEIGERPPLGPMGRGVLFRMMVNDGGSGARAFGAPRLCPQTPANRPLRKKLTHLFTKPFFKDSSGRSPARGLLRRRCSDETAHVGATLTNGPTTGPPPNNANLINVGADASRPLSNTL